MKGIVDSGFPMIPLHSKPTAQTKSRLLVTGWPHLSHASRHQDLPGHSPRNARNPQISIEFENPIQCTICRKWLTCQSKQPTASSPTTVATPSAHSPVAARCPSRPYWPLPPWPAVAPRLRWPQSWLGQWHCSGCPCRRSGFLEREGLKTNEGWNVDENKEIK